MISREGWCDRGYLQLFQEDSILALTEAYGLRSFLSDMVVIGLIGWDDLLVRDGEGSIWTVPTLPMHRKHLEAALINVDAELTPDAELKGKIKWYVAPLIFGGSPMDEPNIVWLDIQKHCELVRWWNVKYEELSAKD